jgi:hypothetical protein
MQRNALGRIAKMHKSFGKGMNNELIRKLKWLSCNPVNSSFMERNHGERTTGI